MIATKGGGPIGLSARTGWGSWPTTADMRVTDSMRGESSTRLRPSRIGLADRARAVTRMIARRPRREEARCLALDLANSLDDNRLGHLTSVAWAHDSMSPNHPTECLPWIVAMCALVIRGAIVLRVLSMHA